MTQIVNVSEFELDIAVVIVTYKCAALTIDSLRSVAAERSEAGFHIRALVVDNASGDAPSIAEAIESNAWRSWVTLVTAPKNGGFAYVTTLESRALMKLVFPRIFTC
jgi:N-acetylglucosaminyl-diphospho-decaprenol L-rhamnosyltransferase